MMPDRVKFHYRKAMLVLHPDKNVNGSAEQRFIAEKVRVGWAVNRSGVMCTCISKATMYTHAYKPLTTTMRNAKLKRPALQPQVFTSVNEAYNVFSAQELK